MKILMLHDAGHEAGGAEIIVATLKQELTRRGHEVRVLAEASPASATSFADYTFPRSFPRALSRLWNVSAYRSMRKVLADYRPDIVNVHSFNHASPSILFAAQGFPTVLTVHNYDVIYPNEWVQLASSGKGWKRLRALASPRFYWENFRYQLVRRRLPAVRRIIVSSDHLANRLRLNPSATRIQKCTYGIPLLNYSAPESFDQLLYMGRLSPEKGIEHLILAMPRIRDAIPQAKLTIVGGGPASSSLQELTSKLGLAEAVTFIGQVANNQIEKYYASASIVVVPSVWAEPFGLTGLEAMSVGRPVIASRIGGITEWLKDGETGYFVAPGSSAEIAERAIQLLRDPALIEEMGRRGRAASQRWTVAQGAAELEQIFGEVIQNR